MSATLITTAGLLDSKALRMLAGKTGPCITIMIPDRHPGAPEGTQRAVLRSHLRTAAGQLAGGALASYAETLLRRLEEISLDPALESGGPGWAIFRFPCFVACYRTHTRMHRLSIASHALLSPFVTDAFAPAESIVLGLNTSLLRLFDYSRGECREIPLPETVPANEEAAGKLGHATRALESRSTYGSARGNSSLVHFGTTSDREKEDVYLHDFFEIVHRGIKPLLMGRPLVLMGVQEEIAAYRRAAKNGEFLLSGEPGSIEFLTPTEIGARVQEAVLGDYHRRGEAVLAELKEMRDRARVATETRVVLRAAAQGRVHQLCARAETPLTGPMEPDLDRVHAEAEDLVNAAIVETLRTGGEVFMLPQKSLNATQPLAAILRY